MITTEVVWAVQGFYSKRYGWETLIYCDTREGAWDMVACYRENEPGIPVRVRLRELARLS